MFSICHQCQWHGWCTLSSKYFRRIFENILNGPNSILRGLGETDTWKKPEVEILVALSLSGDDNIPLKNKLEFFPSSPKVFVFFKYDKIKKAVYGWRGIFKRRALLQTYKPIYK